MKKGLLLIVLLVFGLVGVASAIPTTWTDTMNFDPDVLIPPAYGYFHDISDNFSDGATVDSYSLTIGLYDDNNPYIKMTFSGEVEKPDGSESAAIWTLGGKYSYDFNLTEETYNSDAYSLLGRMDIEDDGTLNVFISQGSSFLKSDNDFYLDYSILTVNGDDGTAPVPEPGTLLLLGSGLAGLAFYRRKKMK